MKTRIYVAAASAEIDRAERVIAALRESPHIEITEDWCATMRDHPPDAQCTREQLAEACRANIRGVETAHFALFLASPQLSQGRAGELAIACVDPTAIPVCSGYWPDLGIFGSLIEPAWTFYSRDESKWESPELRAERVRRDDDHAIHYLRGIALGRASIADIDDVHVCPGCHAVGAERCAPGCVDAEMAEEREASERDGGEACLDCQRQPCRCEDAACSDLEERIDRAMEGS